TASGSSSPGARPPPAAGSATVVTIRAARSPAASARFAPRRAQPGLTGSADLALQGLDHWIQHIVCGIPYLLEMLRHSRDSGTTHEQEGQWPVQPTVWRGEVVSAEQAKRAAAPVGHPEQREVRIPAHCACRPDLELATRCIGKQSLDAVTVGNAASAVAQEVKVQPRKHHPAAANALEHVDDPEKRGKPHMLDGEGHIGRRRQELCHRGLHQLGLLYARYHDEVGGARHPVPPESHTSKRWSVHRSSVVRPYAAPTAASIWSDTARVAQPDSWARRDRPISSLAVSRRQSCGSGVTATVQAKNRKNPSLARSAIVRAKTRTGSEFRYAARSHAASSSWPTLTK